MRKQKQWIERIICAACGIFCALCFDFKEIAPFLWVALVPLFYILLKNKETIKEVIVYAGIFCMSLCLFYYAQMLSLDISARVGNSAVGMLILAWIAISLLYSAIFTAVITVGVRLKCSPALRALLLAVLWVGAEWLMGVGAVGMPLIRLGVTQWQFLPATQSAALFGVLFISFLIVLTNVLLAQGLLYRKKKIVGYVCAAVFLFLANFVFGLIAINTANLPEPKTSIAAIQFNVPFSKNEGEGRYEKAIAMAEQAAQKKPDFILLPENSVFGSFEEEKELHEPSMRIAKSSEGYVLTGVYGIHGFQLRNSMFLVEQNGELAGVYNKQHLVPFFENGYEQAFGFETGNDRGVFKTEHGNLGVVICFESLFSYITSDTVNKGAELLVVATNDSWFTTEEPLERHFAQSVLRAQETGKYLVQVGNDGVTAIISPIGEVVTHLDVAEDGILYGNVSFLPENTLYSVIGDWWILVPAVFVMGMVLWKKRETNLKT